MLDVGRVGARKKKQTGQGDVRCGECPTFYRTQREIYGGGVVILRYMCFLIKKTELLSRNYFVSAPAPYLGSTYRLRPNINSFRFVSRNLLNSIIKKEKKNIL